jgi:hypothetical protein
MSFRIRNPAKEETVVLKKSFNENDKEKYEWVYVLSDANHSANEVAVS